MNAACNCAKPELLVKPCSMYICTYVGVTNFGSFRLVYFKKASAFHEIRGSGLFEHQGYNFFVASCDGRYSVYPKIIARSS